MMLISLGYTFSILFFMIEPITKHQAYVGYFVPKALETLWNRLNLLPNNIPCITELSEFLSCAMVGLASSRGHVVIDGFFNLWN